MRRRSEVGKPLTYEQNYGGNPPKNEGAVDVGLAAIGLKAGFTLPGEDAEQADDSLPPMSVNQPVMLGFDGIVESMHVTDVKALYDKLTVALKLGEQARNDKGKIREAMDEADDNSRLAHLLYCAAVLEFDRWEIEHEPIHGDMWTQAREELETAAKADKSKKSITNEDVKAKASTMFPDEWRRHRLGAKKMKLLVEHTKELADIWSQRSKTLNTMLGTAR